MSGRVRYVVTWVDAEEIKAAARKAGWTDDDAILDWAPAEYHQSTEEFCDEAAAFAWATGVLKVDFFGQVEIEEQVEEVEDMNDGGPPLRSWETTRYRHVTSDGADEWERS
jgi:hypothetical protein